MAVTDPTNRIAELRSRLLTWYQAHRRELPWRDSDDPYAILVSEIMLQQTGVTRVRPIYTRFLARFPSFAALAEAPRWEVLRAWAGAGYNRRAIHLQDIARAVVRDYHGRLPDDPDALRRLPGLGPYTVAAILSFIFHRDVPTLDTNVRRVIGRIELGGQANHTAVYEAAARLVPTGRSSEWNQALMDFGSLWCTAANPRCSCCPVHDLCRFISGSGEPGPALATRKVAERAESYLGSRRYFRGRIVARLRDLPPDASLTIPEILNAVKPGWCEADVVWATEIVRTLASEGLVALREGPGEVRAGPPS